MPARGRRRARRQACQVRMQEILPLKLFDHRQVQAARKTQALKKTGMQPSRQSERRGAEAEDAGVTVLDPTVH